MQVCVFFSKARRALLVLPWTDAPELPTAVLDLSWHRLPDGVLSDNLFFAARPIIEAELGLYGYSVMPIVTPDREPRMGWRFWQKHPARPARQR